SGDESFMSGLDDVARDAIKSGVIQHFEFTYDLCWKFIKRWIETNTGPAVADGVTRRELFRMAAENRLVDDVERWMRHHDARNRTSHSYDPEIAEVVYQAARNFVGDARALLFALVERND
ncbi:MAG: HI0074 family nucleotidyltransferase substrate-binding subunit, partial [Deltaproteobacteria bacterium]|nr:HI0074 family nucleotidyltransferase substrate-binding subunit [Deltaproteobacteria bacterium]